MGQQYSFYESEVPAPTINRPTFNSFRLFGIWPTLYESNKTPVTVDVLEAGLILAFVMLAFCFYLVLPGIRGKERWYCFIRISVSLFLGACIILCNWGQEWEVDEIHSATQYRAFTTEPVTANIGIKIGLRNVNITLKGTPERQVNETINYNERFWWSYPWHQGRIGFGPYAAEINQEFREAQYKGLPYPILWIAEYFTFDGEGIRWGRHYRTAGWYTHIMLWTAFPCWILANILFLMNPRYGGCMTALTGFLMLVGNICWAGIRNFNELKIPFEEQILIPRYGWCFWLNIVAGVICLLIAIVILTLDYIFPDSLSSFFGIDVLKDYEEFYPEDEDDKKRDDSATNGDKLNGASHHEVSDIEGNGTRERPRNTVVQFRKRGPTVKKPPMRRPVAPPRQAPPRPVKNEFEMERKPAHDSNEEIGVADIELKE